MRRRCRPPSRSRPGPWSALRGRSAAPRAIPLRPQCPRRAVPPASRSGGSAMTDVFVVSGADAWDIRCHRIRRGPGRTLRQSSRRDPHHCTGPLKKGETPADSYHVKKQGRCGSAVSRSLAGAIAAWVVVRRAPGGCALPIHPPHNWSPRCAGRRCCATSGARLCRSGPCVILRSMTSAEVIRRLESEGWVRVGGKGDHSKFRHPKRTGHVVVPHPRKDIAVGTLRNIFRQAGWDWS
jgi:predicted RNA binding protein YcfA (HicA-like mRNA interferase family)